MWLSSSHHTHPVLFCFAVTTERLKAEHITLRSISIPKISVCILFHKDYYCSVVNLRPGKFEYYIGILSKGSGRILSNIIYCYLMNLYEEQWAGSTFGCSRILWHLSKFLPAKSHLSRFAFAHQQLQVLWKTKYSRTERSLTPPRG